ncbi:MAG: PA14 domain-containing protein [Planctomycetota bacterium]|jgi:tetratricopeptide (TPR) repeat protein|nr:PA14 domain-containing protein [Planctomycetota bacterium]
MIRCILLCWALCSALCVVAAELPLDREARIALVAAARASNDPAQRARGAAAAASLAWEGDDLDAGAPWRHEAARLRFGLPPDDPAVAFSLAVDGCSALVADLIGDDLWTQTARHLARRDPTTVNAKLPAQPWQAAARAQALAYRGWPAQKLLNSAPARLRATLAGQADMLATGAREQGLYAAYLLVHLGLGHPQQDVVATASWGQDGSADGAVLARLWAEATTEPGAELAAIARRVDRDRLLCALWRSDSTFIEAHRTRASYREQRRTVFAQAGAAPAALELALRWEPVSFDEVRAAAQAVLDDTDGVSAGLRGALLRALWKRQAVAVEPFIEAMVTQVLAAEVEPATLGGPARWHLLDTERYLSSGLQRRLASLRLAARACDPYSRESYVPAGKSVNSMPDLTGRTPVEEKVVPQVDFKGGPESPHILPFGTNVAAIWRGRVVIREAGVYGLGCESDDGSLLYLAGAEVVNNDGNHGMQLRLTKRRLEAGAHEIELHFYQGGGGHGCRLLWQPPGAEQPSVIPTENLQTPTGEPGLHMASFGIGPRAAEPDPEWLGYDLIQMHQRWERYLDRDQEDRAYEVALAIAQVYPDLYLPRFCLGVAMLHRSDYDGAMVQLDGIDGIAESVPSTWAARIADARAWGLERLGRYQEALEASQVAMVYGPSWNLRRIGRLHRYLGNNEQAVAAFTQQLAVEPSMDAALFLTAARLAAGTVEPDKVLAQLRSRFAGGLPHRSWNFTAGSQLPLDLAATAGADQVLAWLEPIASDGPDHHLLCARLALIAGERDLLDAHLQEVEGMRLSDYGKARVRTMRACAVLLEPTDVVSFPQDKPGHERFDPIYRCLQTGQGFEQVLGETLGMRASIDAPLIQLAAVVGAASWGRSDLAMTLAQRVQAEDATGGALLVATAKMLAAQDATHKAAFAARRASQNDGPLPPSTIQGADDF